MKKGTHTTVSVNMSYETKDRLAGLRLNKNESFDSVLQRLLFIEEKFNSRDLNISNEYEIYIGDESRLFRIDWSHDSYIIYYYDNTNHDWSSSIEAWGSCDDDVVSSFADALLLLMAKDDARALLMNMRGELELDGYTVKKL